MVVVDVVLVDVDVLDVVLDVVLLVDEVVLLVVEDVVLLVVDEVVLDVVEEVVDVVDVVVVSHGSQFSFSKQTTPQRIEVTNSVSEGSFFKHTVILPRGAIGNGMGSLPSHNHTIGYTGSVELVLINV